MIWVNWIFVFGLVVFAFGLGSVEIYPLLFVVSGQTVSQIVYGVVKLADKFPQTEVAAAQHLLWLENVGVDESENDIVDFGGSVNGHLYFLVPLGVYFIGNSLSAGVDHAELNPNIAINAGSVDRFEIPAFKNINGKLIAFPLYMRGQGYLIIFLCIGSGLHFERNPLVLFPHDEDTQFYESWYLSKIVIDIAESYSLMFHNVLLILIDSADVDLVLTNKGIFEYFAVIPYFDDDHWFLELLGFSCFEIFSDVEILTPDFELMTHFWFRFWVFYLSEGLDRNHGINVNSFGQAQPLGGLDQDLYRGEGTCS